jgi:hypothetical protein
MTTRQGLWMGARGVVFDTQDEVEAITELSPDLFGVLKVGPKGKASTAHAVQCCGTQFGAALPPFWALNSNAVNEEDGTTKFVPAETPNHVMKRFSSFDPAEPRCPNLLRA